MNTELLIKTLVPATITLGSAIISGILVFYGQQIQQTQSAADRRLAEFQQFQEQKANQVTALVDIVRHQKEMDMNLAMRLLESLLSRYFEEPPPNEIKNKLNERLLLLRMIALNFQDVPINLKPLFENFVSELQQIKDEKVRDSLSEQLKDIAGEVARRQAFRLSFENGFDSGEIDAKENETLTYRNIGLEVITHGITGAGVKVELKTDFGNKIGPFTVGYYDSPLVDNVKINPEMRASIVLISAKANKSAKLRVIAFPGDLAADRFDITEQARELQTVSSRGE